MNLSLTLSPFSDFCDLESHWKELEKRSDSSFFLSWHWIGCLLALSPLSYRILSIRDGSALVGLAVISIVEERALFNRRNLLSLNESGDPSYDAVYIEYNGLLSDRRYGSSPAVAAIDYLCLGADGNLPRIDAIRLSGVAPEYLALARSSGWLVTVRDRKPCYRIDLEALRRSGRAFQSALGRNTRYQIRRSLREYGRSGDVGLRVARDEGEALEDFGRMVALHQATWRGRHRPGAFSNPFVTAFHVDLIRKSFRAGVIELSRVMAGDRIIGFLYNFVFREQVYFYQSGLQYEGGASLRPGFVSHYLCIEHHLRGGSRWYDFMAGDHRYKAQLGERHGDLVWLCAERPTWRNRARTAAREIIAGR